MFLLNNPSGDINSLNLSCCIGFYAYAIIVHTRADQLYPQLLNNLILCLYNVDTLNICMKEFGSEKIIFDKMTAVRT